MSGDRPAGGTRASASEPLGPWVGADLPAFGLGRIPRIAFGPGTFASLPGVVERLGTRTLLVTGTRSFAASPRRSWLLDAMAGRGIELVGEVPVGDEPTPALVDGAVAGHRASGVEVVLGIGGGSALDAAKAIAGLLRTGTSVRDHLEGIGPGLPYPGPAVPLVAVPTTAGTGSEATRNAVLTERGPTGFKRSFRDERLVAADAVVDPDLLAGLPAPSIAANGLDALSQLVEALVSTRASPITDALARSGLAAAREALPAWHADPEGPAAPAARSRMAYAALLSGICLAHAGLGAVHGLASPLGAMFPIPHGAACGAVLAAATEVNLAALEARDPTSDALARYAELGRHLGGLPGGTPDSAACAQLVRWIRSLVERLGVPRLAQWGVTEADVPRIVAGSRGSSMRTNPITLTDEELADIVRASL